MIQRLVQASSKMTQSVVWAIGVFVIAFVAFEGWMLVLRKPYTEYQKVVATRKALVSSLQQSPDRSSELILLASEIKRLSEQLSGALKFPASDDKMAATLMEALDHSAHERNITFSGVKPLDRKQVSVFEEVSFEISAKGTYLQLCGWMQDFGNVLGNNATITEFDMKAVDEGKQVAISMKIALYRPLKLSEVSNAP